jgi:hypothetical protein
MSSGNLQSYHRITAENKGTEGIFLEVPSAAREPYRLKSVEELAISLALEIAV